MTTERGRLRVTGFDSEQAGIVPDDNSQDLSTGEHTLTKDTADNEQHRWTEDDTVSERRRWDHVWHRLRHNRPAMIGFGVVCCLVLLAVFARPITVGGVPVQPLAIAPYEPDAIVRFHGSNAGQYAPPSLSHPMGTDGSGRDLFSRVIYGGRYSISIALVVVGITATVGIIYGGVSGYVGGWVDELLMRLVDLVFAFPALVLAMVLAAMLGGGYWQLVAAFSLVGWASYARLIRGEVLKVKQHEYVLASRGLGASDRRILFKHVVPNAITPVVVQASLSVGTVVIGVAALGFLGIGFESGTPEWGTMLDGTRETLIRGPGGTIPWWATVFPGGAIFAFVMAMNLIGDAINDALAVKAEQPLEPGRR